jgi:DNA-binding SARP family transcriptional activator
MPQAPRLQISTLGTLQVVRDGHPVAESDWHTRQARQLLKILITERPRPVATDRLIEILWPNSTPNAAATTLRSAINALRNVLEPNRANRAPSRYIHTQAPGYAFRMHPDIWLDVEIFEAALRHAQAAADPRDQIHHLQHALDLYRDDYLISDPYADWAKAERERLQERYFDALLRLAELHATLGDHTAAIAECRRILARDEVRENAYQSLMRYQAESGDSAAALLTYERCRMVLAEELGADPSPLTQLLHQRILNGQVETRSTPYNRQAWADDMGTGAAKNGTGTIAHEGSDPSSLGAAPWAAGTADGLNGHPSLAPGHQNGSTPITPEPRQTLPQQILLPSLEEVHTRIFVGRQCESSKADQVLSQALKGEGHLLILDGEMGVGKTRLAYQTLQQAVEQGATVISGSCQPLERQLPYASLTDGIGRYLAQLPLSSLRHLPMASLAQLTQIIPSLQDRLPSLQLPPMDASTSNPDENRQRLMDGIVGFLSALANLRPLVIFLDDLHWADSDTIAVLSRLARRVPQLPLLTILAYRTGDLAENDDLIALLRSWQRLPHAHTIGLERLRREHVHDYVAQLVGEENESSTALADGLFEVTLGNTLFLTEALRAMQELSVEPQIEHSPEQPGILHIWRSHNGRSLSLRRSQRVQEIIRERIERLPDTALEVLNLSAVFGRNFSIDLLETAANTDPIDGLEILLHRQFLVERMDGRLDFSHQIVRQVAYDSLSMMHRRRLHRRVGDALIRLGRADQIPSETAFHFSQAGQGMWQLYTRYSVQAGESMLRTYGFRQAVRHFDDALDVLEDRPERDQGERELVRRALTGRGLAFESLFDPDGITDTYRRLRTLAGEMGDHPLLLQAHSRLTALLMLVGQQRESNTLFRELVELMDSDPVPAVADLFERHAVIYGADSQDDVAGWSPLTPAPTLHGDPVAEILHFMEPVHAVVPLWEYGWTLRVQGQLDASRRCLQKAAEIGVETAQLSIASTAYHQLAVLAGMTGDDAESLRLNERSIALNSQGQGASAKLVSLWPRIASAFHSLNQGNIPEAEGRLERVLAILGETDAFRNHRNSTHICLGLVRTEQGRLDEAEGLIRDALADMPTLYPYTHVRGLLGLAQIHHERGQTDASAAYLRQALDFAGQRSLVEEYVACVAMIARLRPDAAPVADLVQRTRQAVTEMGFVAALPLLGNSQ